MTMIEGAACFGEVPVSRTAVVISDSFVIVTDGPLWVQAGALDGPFEVTTVGAGSTSKRLPAGDEYEAGCHRTLLDVYRRARLRARTAACTPGASEHASRPSATMRSLRRSAFAAVIAAIRSCAS